MKVLFVYKYLTLGGVESVLRARLESLAETGVDSHAWFLADGPGQTMFRDIAGRIAIGSPQDLVRYADRMCPDLICTIDTEEIFPVFADMPGPPRLVVESHSPYRENRVYLRWLKRLPVAAFWVPSRYQASVIGRRLESIAPIRVVPNLLGSNFADPELSFPAPTGSPKIGWVGRLDEVKNWAMLLEIASEILPDDGQVELCVVGAGDGHRSEERFYSTAEERGLLNHLRWFESLPPQHMPRWLDWVRDSGGVVVSTSRHESFGLSVVEAMARACPVVVPNTGPFPEFIKDGEQGVLYKPGSSKQAAEKIRWLLGDAGARQRLGAQARQRVLAEFSTQAALPVLLGALEAATGHPLEVNGRAR